MATKLKPSEMENNNKDLWLQKFLEIIARKRLVMYRFVSQSLQILVWGNGGGVVLLVGLISGGNANERVHWGIILTLLIFLSGVIMAAIALIFTTAVAIKEAHTVETAMYRFLKDEMSREEALVYEEKDTFKWVNVAAICGSFSAIAFIAGLVFSVIQVSLFF
mgnify:CR=1 FL=1